MTVADKNAIGANCLSHEPVPRIVRAMIKLFARMLSVSIVDHAIWTDPAPRLRHFVTR